MLHRGILIIAALALAGCNDEATTTMAGVEPAAAANEAATAGAEHDGTPVAPAWARFAGPNQRVEEVVEGRLSAGSKGDAILVLRGTDPALISANDGIGNPSFDDNPRTLVHVQRRGEVWQRVGAVENFLPPAEPADAPCLADPLEEGGISIARGVLIVRLHYWLSCGSYFVHSNQFTFRVERGRLRLIGFDQTEFSRSTHEHSEVSVNLLTGEVVYTHQDGPEPEVSPAPPVTTRRSRTAISPVFIQAIDTSCPEADRQRMWCGGNLP